MDLNKQFETTDRRGAYALALAGFLSITAAFVAVSLSEAVRVLSDPNAGSLLRSAFLFLFAVDGSLLVLWLLAITALAATALFILKRTVPRARRVFLFAEIVVLLGGALLCYAKLAEYTRFIGYLPFIAVHVLVFAVLVARSLLFPEPAPGLAPSRLKALLGEKLLPAAAFVLFLAFCILNYLFYYDQYPTLHTCVVMLSFLLFQAGAFTVASSFMLRVRRTVPIVVGISVLAAAIAISVPLSRLRTAQQYRSDFARFTVLGQEISRLSWEAENTVLSKPGTGAFDPEGVARFRAQSGLPALPDDFNLLNYNILLISVEAFRADETSMNNPERNLTPHLLSYAESGAHWFTRAYTGAAYTVQSIASLFTMSYPSASGLQIYDARWSGYLTKEYPVVSDYLKNLGYDTFWISYSGGGSEEGHLGWCWPRFETVQCFRTDKEILQATKKALTKRKDGLRPFFGWAFFPAPHAPYTAHFDDMPDKTDKDRYRQELRYVDGIIDELLTFLRETGLDKNTIVIIHGDHGEEFKEHGKGGHESLYSECSHVPLIVNIPGFVGQRNDIPTSLVYVFPWLFSKGSPELRSAARSRMERVFGPILEATDGAVLSEIFGSFGTRSLLVYPDYHFHHDFASNHNELYDILEDSGEKKNLFNDNTAFSQKFIDRFNRYAEVRKKILNVQFTDGTVDAQESSEEKRARLDAVKKLQEAGEDEILAALLQNKSWIVQRDAITFLCALPTLKEESIDELIKTLVDKNWGLRWRAATEIGNAKAPGIDERLLHSLRSDSPLRNLSYIYGEGKPHTMAEAVDKMLKSRKKKALPAIIAALESDDIELLRYATRAVGTYSSEAEEAVPRLTALTEHPDSAVRQNAQKSLEQVDENN